MLSKHNSSLVYAVISFALIWGTLSCSRREPLPGDPVATTGVPFSTPTQQSSAAVAPGPIESRLFPSDLILENQGALGIQPSQKEAILGEVERAQAEMMRLQWDLQAEKDQLAQVVGVEHIEETKAVEAAAKVMALENKIKARHLKLLIRIKNLLTAEQQSRLQKIRSQGR